MMDVYEPYLFNSGYRGLPWRVATALLISIWVEAKGEQEATEYAAYRSW